MVTGWLRRIFGSAEIATGKYSQNPWDNIQASFFRAWCGSLIIAILLSGASAGLKHDTWQLALQSSLNVVGIGVAVSAASATVAWLFGLLFGIPRSVARVGAATPPSSETKSSATDPSITSRVNTNLEDVSDWLTKTLIGVGLTQLFAIPSFAWRYSTAMDKATLNGQGGGALLILTLAAAGGAGGFWLGYVSTRTVLTRLFDMFDRGAVASDDAATILREHVYPGGQVDKDRQKVLTELLRELRVDIPLSRVLDLPVYSDIRSRLLQLARQKGVIAQ
jgi:hypothetical protein